MRWLVLTLVVMAGCTQPPSGETEDTQDTTPNEPEPAAFIELQDCLEVSAVSIYPRSEYQAVAGPPEPLAASNIRSLIGPGVIASANGVGWVTAMNEVAGHWHTSVECQSGQFNGTDLGLVQYGYVGVHIEAPPWDPTNSTHHVLLAVNSWPTALANNFEIATTPEAILVHPDTPASGWFHMLLDDDHNGRYEGMIPMDPAPARAAGNTTFWTLKPTSGMHNHHDQIGPFTPYYYVASDAQGAAFYPRETVGEFSHTETDHHAPLPGGAGNSGGAAVAVATRTIGHWNHVNVTLDQTWVH